VTDCYLIKSPHLVLETAEIQTNSREPESGSRHATCEDPRLYVQCAVPSISEHHSAKSSKWKQYNAGTTHPVTQHHIPQYANLQQHCCLKLRVPHCHFQVPPLPLEPPNVACSSTALDLSKSQFINFLHIHCCKYYAPQHDDSLPLHLQLNNI
jgi:hypothetical protein